MTLLTTARQECTNIFSSGGGETLANEFGCAFLGRLPIDRNVCEWSESGTMLERYRECTTAKLMQQVVRQLLSTLEKQPESSQKEVCKGQELDK
jgi:hypothetical protein